MGTRLQVTFEEVGLEQANDGGAVIGRQQPPYRLLSQTSVNRDRAIGFGMPQELHLVQNDNRLESAGVRDKDFSGLVNQISHEPAIQLPPSANTACWMFGLLPKQVRRQGLSITGNMDFRRVRSCATVSTDLQASRSDLSMVCRLLIIQLRRLPRFLQ